MRRAWIAVLAVAALAMPAAAFAHGDDGSPSSKENRSKACKALRAQMGTELFRQTYGANRSKRNAHGKCVSGHRKVLRRLVKQAIEECKAEREAAQLRHSKGDDDDRPKADRRAFRECVKEKLRALVTPAVEACKAERAADLAAFKEKYGKGKKQRHAFLRCVVQTLQASQAPTVPSAS